MDKEESSSEDTIEIDQTEWLAAPIAADVLHQWRAAAVLARLPPRAVLSASSAGAVPAAAPCGGPPPADGEA